MNSKIQFFIFINLVTLGTPAPENVTYGYGELFDPNNCCLNPAITKEIQNYAPIVKKIINSVTKGKYRNTTYERLAEFVDTFGGRFIGSATLEESIDYLLNKSNEFGFKNVRAQNAKYLNWIRGEESAEMVEPRRQKLNMISVSRSNGTEGKEIKGEVVLFESLDEYFNFNQSLKGKVVVFNLKHKNLLYEAEVLGREFLDSQNSGAIAILTKSVASVSLNVPRASQIAVFTHVPCVFLTVDDANMLNRIYRRKQKIVISLKLDARQGEEITSRNVIADFEGTELKDKIVIISGHIDSYDVGVGAVDDGAGLYLAWNSMVILKGLGLIPKRTLRFIGWTVEEYGLIGAKQYLQDYANETENINVAMESDIGVFTPLGLDFGGTRKGACVMHEIVQ